MKKQLEKWVENEKIILCPLTKDLCRSDCAWAVEHADGFVCAVYMLATMEEDDE